MMRLVNQQLIKDTNLKQIYQYIYENRGISRAGLAKASKLSKTTVSFLVDELIERGFILDSGTVDSGKNVGRKPNSLEIRSEQWYVIVVKWEKNAVEAFLVDISGMAIPMAGIELKEKDAYPELTRKCVDKILEESVDRSQILGVGIIVPAMIDPEKEEIYATTLKISPDKAADMIPRLKDCFRDFPVAILNDTACYAYAEKVYSYITEKDFAYINFDRGIGAALFIGGEMLGRASASYTQFGHYSVNPEGELCSCGNRGCLELMIGEESVPDRMLRAGGRKVAGATYEELGKAAVYGDRAAGQVIQDIAGEFSGALANMICMVHPKLIILGGKGRELGPRFLEEIRKKLKQTGFRRMVDEVEVRYSILDESACLRGAMKYFFDIHYRFTVELAGTFHIG